MKKMIGALIGCLLGGLLFACEQEQGAPTCGGGVYDSQNGICWQSPRAPDTMTWQVAMDYCANLELAGYSDWELPSHLDWANLLGGCPSGVLDGTSAGSCTSCWRSAQCDLLFNDDSSEYWSSSLAVGYPENAYSFIIGQGWTSRPPITESHHVRCIRK